MQEVGGSIPPGSTSLRPLHGYGWQASLRLRSLTKLSVREVAKVARRSPQGEGGPDRLSSDPMKYVYLLQSIDCPEETYVGLTDDLRSRLAAHNAGQSAHTAKFKPWRLVSYLGFTDAAKAVDLSAI